MDEDDILVTPMCCQIVACACADQQLRLIVKPLQHYSSDGNSSLYTAGSGMKVLRALEPTFWL